jgi:hypothetical protein
MGAAVRAFTTFSRNLKLAKCLSAMIDLGSRKKEI